MTFFINKTKNYTDYTDAYSVDDNVTHLLKTLETETNLVLKWFRTNEMKANDSKCHLLVANQTNVFATLGSEIIEATNYVELLGIKIDKHLHLSELVSSLCKKGNHKLHALARISKYSSEDKLKIIMKTFIQSHFN